MLRKRIRTPHSRLAADLARERAAKSSQKTLNTVAVDHLDHAALIARCEALAEDRMNLVAMAALIQTKLQPPGSPPPGGIMSLCQWVIDRTVEKIDALEARGKELERQVGVAAAERARIETIIVIVREYLRDGPDVTIDRGNLLAMLDALTGKTAEKRP